MPNTDKLEKVLEVLVAARRQHKPIGALPENLKPATVDEGYMIQEALTRRLGEQVSGWKIAATNEKAQKLIGTGEPFAGPLFATMLHESPAKIPAAEFNMRIIEGEFAFKLGEDLPARRQAYSRAEVESAVESLHPAIEIADSRFSDWLSVGLASLIADGAVSGAFVYGSGVSDWRDLDLINCEVTMTVDGVDVGSGSGAGALGDPMRSLVWLVNHCGRLGTDVRAGQMVTTGTCTGNYKVAGQASVKADFGALGDVLLEFT